MSDIELEPEVSRFIPFFYPSALSSPPNAASSANSLAEHLRAKPDDAGSLATDLPTFLLHIAAARPAHTDKVLQAVQILIEAPSLPLINNWDSSRPNTTFEELFHIAFRENVNNAVLGPIEVGERESYIAASLLAARARNFGLLETPEIVGSLAEGLAFSDEVIYNYQGEVAEIAAIGACIQLLGGGSSLLQDQPKRFAKDKLLAALDNLKFADISALIEVTKSHLEKELLENLTSEAIVNGLKAVGWRFPGDLE